MRKLTLSLIILFQNICGHSQTQSIIYDAVTIMNAKYGVNALLIPTGNGYDLYDPLMGKQIPNDPNTGKIDTSRASLADSLFRNNTFSNNIIYSILKRNAGISASTSDADVYTFYSSNPFIKSFLDALSIRSIRETDFLKEVSKYITDKSSGGIGHDILGNLTNGTADFLIKRAQEEISISVFEKLKAFITRFPEFDTLFPRTCALIKPVDAYEYSKALQAFKDAIHEDLKVLVPRIALLYHIERYKLLNERVPSLTLVFSASAMFSELHNKSGFAETLCRLGQQSFLSERNNYANFLKVLITFSNSLLDKKLSDPEDKTPTYIQKEFIKLATHNNPDLWHDLSQVYLGLIWQHTRDLNFTTGTSTTNFAQLLEHWATSPTIATALKTVDITINAIVEADNDLAAIKKTESEESQVTGKSQVRIERFTIYAKLVSQLLGLSELYVSPSNGAFSDRIKEIRQYMPEFTTGIMTMIKDFEQEEYNLGISKFAEVLKTSSNYIDQMKRDKTLADMFSTEISTALIARKNLLESKKQILKDRIIALPPPNSDPQINANIEAEKQELTASIEKIENELTEIAYEEPGKKSAVYKLSKVIEYINLLAAISKAENSAAVESLLETYALPAGSSRIKKVTSFNIAANAYVGGFFGRSKKQGEGFTNTYGLTAPIGFTFSTGFQRAGSLSLFAGLFDIGGTIRYKLDNQGKYQQDISLAGIVSPSLHAVYGFPWFLPLSAGIGCQWISPTTTTSNKIDLKPSFNAFIAVDIPLFNLFTKK